MDKKFVKSVLMNNVISIVIEISFLGLVVVGFFDSLMESYPDVWIDIRFISLAHLAIIVICGGIFKLRYNLENDFMKITKYYLFSFLLLNLFLSFLVFSLPVFNDNPFVFIGAFLGFNLISIIISFIDFKLRGVRK